MGRSRAKLRRSPFTEYCRAGKVTLRPPVLRSQIEKPTSFRPSSGPPLKCSSASANLPGGLPLSFGKNFTVIDLPPPDDSGRGSGEQDRRQGFALGWGRASRCTIETSGAPADRVSIERTSR